MRKITPTEPRKIAFLSRDTVAWPGLSSLCRADWNLHQLFTLLTTFCPNMVKIGTLKSFSLLLYTNELFLSLSHFGPVKILQIP